MFSAGPTHQIQEQTVRRTARPPLAPGNAPVTFTIGPVDFPDTVKDQKATGARFLNNVRGYSGTSMTNVEHYCLDCSFRPWLDATNDLTATLVITHPQCPKTTEHVDPSPAGAFKSRSTLGPGDSAAITIEDAWGDSTAAPVTVAAS